LWGKYHKPYVHLLNHQHWFRNKARNSCSEYYRDVKTFVHLIYIFIWRDILQRRATFTIYTAFSIAVLVNGRSQWPWYHTVIRCHLLNIESKISQACTSTFLIINSDFYKYQEIATMNISAMSIHLCMSYTPGVIFYNKHRCISLTYEDEV
jgi:hypothetical protein